MGVSAIFVCSQEPQIGLLSYELQVQRQPSRFCETTRAKRGVRQPASEKSLVCYVWALDVAVEVKAVIVNNIKDSSLT